MHYVHIHKLKSIWLRITIIFVEKAIQDMNFDWQNQSIICHFLPLELTINLHTPKI